MKKKVMSLISENLKYCSVKITAIVSGGTSIGSGVIYQTPIKCNYNYILTAKHIISEDSNTVFDLESLSNLKIECFNDDLVELYRFKSNEINWDNFIIFEEDDLAVIKIPKVDNRTFPSILVTDSLENDELTFSSWSIFKANEDEFSPFKYHRNDYPQRKIELIENVPEDYLNGMSGSGVFIQNKNILFGIISKYPNIEFASSTIQCSKISFESINVKLASRNLIKLDTKESKLKREIEGRIVELYQARINNAFLDLELALKRVRTDMNDDWYYDSLQYIDLLNFNFLYKQLSGNFYENNYKASLAEKFYVPKTNFTLREAYILPITDRIIYMAIVGGLAELIEDSLIPHVFASRYNRINQENLLINGVEQWKKLRYKIEEDLYIRNEKYPLEPKYKYNCVLHVDILNYYDNIDKKILIEKLTRIAVSENDLNIIKLLESFLKEYSCKNSGLPQNNDSSALLSTFYLNQVDVFMSNHSNSYYRFADDIRILCKDKYEARKYLVLLEKELKRCQLSVNSQKTKIVEIRKDNSFSEKTTDLLKERSSYSDIFNLRMERIRVLAKSSSYQYRNEAFHDSIKLLSESINMDSDENDDESRNLRFSLSIIENLCKSKIHFQTESSDFFIALSKAVDSLKDKPWITFQLCKIMVLVEKEQFELHFLDVLKELVLDENLNLYPYQQFQVWLLLAKQKIECMELKKYASQKIEVNDSTTIATTSAQILYLSTVDKNFKRLLFRKLNENFTSGYFQNRAVLIALRSFNLIEPNNENIHNTLTSSFEFTSKYGDKELVYYNDIESSFWNESLIEEFFSL